MNELIKFIVISGLIFLLFLVTLILGVTKKNKKLKLTSVIIFFIFICMTVWTGFKFATKTYNKVTETLRPRTGDEIYDALFEKRQTDCINILHYQDQVVPKIDYAIWLHLKTCPKELKRIIGLHDFKTEVLSTSGWKTDGPLAHENWFKPESLGDSILVFTYKKDEYGNGQYIYSSLDSSIVFIKDVYD